MQVILLERVQNLGDLGDSVKVKPGYARNYLIPQGRAVIATAANVAELEAKRAELQQQEAQALASVQARADALEGKEITLARKTGEEGKLFGSVGPQDIADALTESGTPVSRNEVRLVDDTLRQVGDYEVGVHLHANVEASITVHVVAED
ncbi:MAG: 50S ribosomal protein L9 [Gammaproteobacteria bacterium]|jgi:large subunit ribosomal protein L9|nr:50S ribosomal protein L9 [Gammaproteobacteria bacterium]MDX2462816.1 50S ribosomal protein L9 [Gammaproteobacteria bacterium]